MVSSAGTIFDGSFDYIITGAPRTARCPRTVFISNAGAEFGVRGYLSADQF